VHLKNETSVNYIFFKAVYVPTSPNPFNITGRLYVMQTMDVEELRALDLEGVIVLGSRVNFTNDVFSQAVYEGKGLKGKNKVLNLQLCTISFIGQ
jgi:hypothetical protein